MKIISKRIEVITTHDKEGKVIPIRFRINIDGELKAYNVKVKVQESFIIEKENVLSYKCEIQDEGYKKECVIRFYKSNSYWTLYQM